MSTLAGASVHKICFAVPGAKHYETTHYTNCRNSFVHVSVTGTECSLQCEHCQGKLLEGMLPAASPQELRELINDLIKKGCRGILLSGGADQQGEVPLRPFAGEIAYARQRGLKVLVHCGLISRESAGELQRAGVQQALMDIIGDKETIRDVYHLDRPPRDYLQAMLNCREAGLDFAPHVVMGLNFGRISGEYRALEMIQQAGARVLVLVVFTPMRGTNMGICAPVPVEEAVRLVRQAREMLPDARITLGCAKPPGRYREVLEKAAVDCGIDVIAFPAARTVEYAEACGHDTTYKEECCSACNI